MLQVGYLGARGRNLDRAVLVNNAPAPASGPLQPRRPYQTISFVPGTVLQPDFRGAGLTFPGGPINLLVNNGRSQYGAGWILARRAATATRRPSARRAWSPRSRRTATTWKRSGAATGAALHKVDLALEKRVPVRRDHALVFRTEIFNLFNHTNLGTPERFVNTPQFGTIIMAATPARQIQFALRYVF
jgi:hypothetical protein